MATICKVVGLGGGGHAAVVLDILALHGGYDVIGILDADPARRGSRVLGVPVLGGDDLLDDLSSGSGVTHFFVGMGSVGAPTVRRRLFDAGVRHGLIPITTVHPRATVAESATLGEGSAIMAGAVIGVRAIIGDNAIVNTGALVDHDCRVGCHAHVSTGAQLAGGVTIGDGAHVSIGATVIQGVAVGEGAIVGAGAVVLRPVSPHVTVVGVPAHTLDRRDAT